MITAKPGFDWALVRWTGPDALVDDDCSYCAAPIPETDVPLRIWQDNGSAAVFCRECMATWFGMHGIDDDEDPDDQDPPIH